MNDSLSSGQPLYLLYSATESARVTSTTLRPSASRDIAILAIGRVRFHVTGSPPTWRVRTAAPRAVGATVDRDMERAHQDDPGGHRAHHGGQARRARSSTAPQTTDNFPVRAKT